MNQIPTAKEFLLNKQCHYEKEHDEFDCVKIEEIKELISLHIDTALKAAVENIEYTCGYNQKSYDRDDCGKWCGGCENRVVKIESILDCYPLNKIK